jgi:phage terminase large subunit-like protein
VTSYRQKLTSFLRQIKPNERQAFLAGLDTNQLRHLMYDWQIWARHKQLPPEGEWVIWLIMAGRGFGKTRAGAEWIRSVAMAGTSALIALVGHTMDDVRHVMIEGQSGILNISPREERPIWFPSKRLLVWPNGVRARCYSAEDPSQLRGPEHEKAWCDEIAKWRYSQTWENLMLGLRAGQQPQVLATTTPRPLRWLTQLSQAPEVRLVQGHSKENQANLAGGFLEMMARHFKDPALLAQELEGRLMTEMPNALWDRLMLDQCRATPPRREQLISVVIGVDPAVEGGDETGIIVSGKTEDGMIWILEDQSIHARPRQWVDRIVSVWRRWKASAIVVEVNQGGDVISELLRSQQINLPIRKVRAKHGKVIRAEPVAMMYASDQIRHAGIFPALEDQMCSCVPGQVMSPSPDRLDAMVWAVTGLQSAGRAKTSALPF